MRRSLWYRLDALGRNLAPFGFTMALVIVSMVPMRLPEFAAVAPMLALMAVYHWAVYHPELLPAPTIFIIGLIQDFLSGASIGVHALIFLFVYMGVLAQRQFLVGKTFAIVWFGFGLVAAAASFINWLVESAFAATLLDLSAPMAQYLVTLGCFPVLSWLFLRWQQAFLKND